MCSCSAVDLAAFQCGGERICCIRGHGPGFSARCLFGSICTTVLSASDVAAEVLAKRDQMDKGLHIGSWGQLQGKIYARVFGLDSISLVEWKVDRDSPTDTHRHLSHLIGLYPGYAIVSYDPTLQKSGVNYTREEVLQAASVSLLHRGNGTGPDGDAGWEKVWRAAGWAQLGDSKRFYHELTVRDFVPGQVK